MNISVINVDELLEVMFALKDKLKSNIQSLRHRSNTVHRKKQKILMFMARTIAGT